MKEESVEGTWRITRPGEGAGLTDRLHLARHMAAYDFAAAHMPPSDIVVDVACGFGVGVDHLFERKAVREVVAMDLARNALDSLADRPGLRKVRSDATQLPLQTDSIDTLLAFQLIEHVPRDGAVMMLKEFQRVIKPGGMAFVTTPNARWRLLPFQKPWNPYHVKEYRPREIERLGKDAELQDYDLLGLIGSGGAHETEIKRVRQNPLTVYMRLEGRPLWYLRRAAEALGLASGARESAQSATDTPSYAFGRDFERGIDFMIVIRKPHPAS